MTTLKARQVAEFHRDGFLIVDEVFNPDEDIAPIFREYQHILDGLAEDLLNRGLISDVRAGAPFEDRILAICQESAVELTPNFDLSFPERAVTEDSVMHLSPTFFDLLTHPALLDIVESIVGPEVLLNPANKTRIKLPDSLAGSDFTALTRQTPWHQDQAVLTSEAAKTHLLTAWVALNESTAENGALEIVTGSHSGDFLVHCARDFVGPTIPDSLIDGERVVLPMKPGSVLLLSGSIVHRSLPNSTTDQVRMSWDLRYQPVDEPTGRPQFPGFVVRSRMHPESVVRDADVWARAWRATKDRWAYSGDSIGAFYTLPESALC